MPFRLAIDNSEGRRQEFYPTEAMAQRALRVLAGYPETIRVALYDRATGDMLAEYRRPEPESPDPFNPDPAVFGDAPKRWAYQAGHRARLQGVGVEACPQHKFSDLWRAGWEDAAPEPAAPSAPVAPPAPRQPIQPRPEPAANPILLAWWHDAAASWRAYQSPADHAALARCQEAIAVLLAALPDATRREPMIRAVKAGRAFPARWFATERNTG